MGCTHSSSSSTSDRGHHRRHSHPFLTPIDTAEGSVDESIAMLAPTGHSGSSPLSPPTAPTSTNTIHKKRTVTIHSPAFEKEEVSFEEKEKEKEVVVHNDDISPNSNQLNDEGINGLIFLYPVVDVPGGVEVTSTTTREDDDNRRTSEYSNASSSSVVSSSSRRHSRYRNHHKNSITWTSSHNNSRTSSYVTYGRSGEEDEYSCNHDDDEDIIKQWASSKDCENSGGGGTCQKRQQSQDAEDLRSELVTVTPVAAQSASMSIAPCSHPRTLSMSIDI